MQDASQDANYLQKMILKIFYALVQVCIKFSQLNHCRYYVHIKFSQLNHCYNDDIFPIKFSLNLNMISLEEFANWMEIVRQVVDRPVPAVIKTSKLSVFHFYI